LPQRSTTSSSRIPDVSTIGGYLTSLLGRIPGVGESTAIGKYLATITLADERSIQEIEFFRSQENDEEPLADSSTEEGTTEESGVEEPTVS
jgi:CBS domain containing-hemolysin-like protein